MNRRASEVTLSLATGPYYQLPEATAAIIGQVVVALVPAVIAGWFFFGIHALSTIAQCIVFSVAFEAGFDFCIGRSPRIADGSAFLAGLLLACNLPPLSPWYVCAAGSFAAIVVVKGMYGGLGKNIFNPVLAGRAFCMAAFPAALSAYVIPVRSFLAADALTGATPLAVLKTKGMAALIAGFGDTAHLSLQLLLGNRGGSIGETSAIALIAGGAFLLIRGIITWHIPVSMIVTTGLIAFASGLHVDGAMVHCMSGGLLLGAFFMATDYTTAPVYPLGKIIFGMGCAAILMTIRLWGAYPEGCMFGILIMNIFTPTIDRITFPRRFGEIKRRAQ